MSWKIFSDQRPNYSYCRSFNYLQLSGKPDCVICPLGESSTTGRRSSGHNRKCIWFIAAWWSVALVERLCNWLLALERTWRAFLPWVLIGWQWESLKYRSSKREREREKSWGGINHKCPDCSSPRSEQVCLDTPMNEAIIEVHRQIGQHHLQWAGNWSISPHVRSRHHHHHPNSSFINVYQRNGRELDSKTFKMAL
jgi:hypothetical protein